MSADTLNSLDNAINRASPYSDDDLTQSLNALSDKVSSDDATTALADEIKQLSGYALSVDDSFFKIEQILGNIRTSGVSPGVQADISGLTNTWKGYRQEYINLLWLSREVAGAAEGCADDFSTDFITFLSDDEPTLQEKKQEIKNYTQKLDADEKRASDMSQRFANLQKNISVFQEDWQKVINKYNLAALAQEVKQLDTDIHNLESTMANLQQKVANLTAALGCLRACPGVAGVLCFICPIFWFRALCRIHRARATADLLNQASRERDDCARQIAQKKAVRDQKAADLEALRQLKAGLEKSQSDFNNICEKLGAFSSVWAAVRADLQAIEEKLEYTNTTSSKLLFKTRLRNAAQLYSTLGKALRQYQVVVNISSPVFRNMA